MPSIKDNKVAFWGGCLAVFICIAIGLSFQEKRGVVMYCSAFAYLPSTESSWIELYQVQCNRAAFHQYVVFVENRDFEVAFAEFEESCRREKWNDRYTSTYFAGQGNGIDKIKIIKLDAAGEAALSFDYRVNVIGLNEGAPLPENKKAIR